MKAYECVRCAMWEHLNGSSIRESRWMREAFDSFISERKEIMRRPEKATVDELEDLTNVRDILAGYYGEENLTRM